jgi:hypothetical protein
MIIILDALFLIAHFSNVSGMLFVLEFFLLLSLTLKILHSLLVQAAKVNGGFSAAKLSCRF